MDSANFWIYFSLTLDDNPPPDIILKNMLPVLQANAMILEDVLWIGVNNDNAAEALPSPYWSI